MGCGMKIRLTSTVMVEPLTKHNLAEGRVLDVVSYNKGQIAPYTVRSDAGVLVGVCESQCIVVERDTDREQRKFRTAFDKWLVRSTLDLPTGDSDECPICGQYAGEEYHLVHCFGSQQNVAVSMESGPWNAFEWQELRHCPRLDCGAFFVVENCNY